MKYMKRADTLSLSRKIAGATALALIGAIFYCTALLNAASAAES
jgi:hypothetical protein